MADGRHQIAHATLDGATSRARSRSKSATATTVTSAISA
jgi:hypothetical protein